MYVCSLPAHGSCQCPMADQRSCQCGLALWITACARSRCSAIDDVDQPIPVLRKNAVRRGMLPRWARGRTLWHDERMVTFGRIALRLIEDALRWVVLLFRSTESVHAENLFLRRQLALYIEHGSRRDR